MGTNRVLTEIDPLVDEIDRCIPRFVTQSSKGTSGRVAVIGGSPSYTGAPYFASMAALHTGADLAYVFTSTTSAPAIKNYTPEFIVHPILEEANFLENFIERMANFTSVVLGPGLGRPGEVMTSEQFNKLIDTLRQHHMPLILDADGLFFLAKNPSIVHSYREAILTPNMRELRRIFKAVIGRELPADANDVDEQDIRLLAKKLGNVTICVKGVHDKISDGNSCVIYCGNSGPRRCGGQGDIMAGMIATFSYWMHKSRGPPERELPAKVPHKNSDKEHSGPGPTPPSKMPATILACLASSILVRKCGRSAFLKYQRGTIASHFIDEISSSFHALFPKANTWVWA